MAIHNAFPLVRGKKIRVTSLDNCCSPNTAFPPTTRPPSTPPMVDFIYSVSSGFVSVALTANSDAGDTINVKNASGATCVNDIPCPLFLNYGVEITFCEVQPCIFSMLTGQGLVLGGPTGTDVVGFTMNSQPGDVCARPFALEIWTGVVGMPCQPGVTGGMFGYILLPCVQPGQVGDFTVENGAASFVISGAQTRDGTNWGRGPWAVSDGTHTPPAVPPAALLAQDLDTETHLHLQYTHQPPPADTDACVYASWTPGPPGAVATPDPIVP